MDVLGVVQIIVELTAVLLLVRPVGGYVVSVFLRSEVDSTRCLVRLSEAYTGRSVLTQVKKWA